MSENDPYEGSPYDASGMPLATTYADYDNSAEIAQNMVRSKEVVEDAPSLNSPEYVEPALDIPEPFDRKGFNSAIADDVNRAYTEFEAVDMNDAGAKRELYVREAEAEGYSAVQELPKVEDESAVESIKEDIKSEEDKPVEENKPAEEVTPEHIEAALNDQPEPVVMTPAEPQPVIDTPKEGENNG